MLVTCLDGVLQYNAVINMQKTISCGQTFRWYPAEKLPDASPVLRKTPLPSAHEGAGRGFVCSGIVGCGDSERAITVSQNTAGDMCVSVSTAEFQAFWQDYFDLQTDYSPLSDLAENDPFFAACLDFGSGIRVLRQNLWETVVTFILSQNNNIPRIQGCIHRLVSIFGHFPLPGEILLSQPEQLNSIRCGYRVPYLLDAAKFTAYTDLYGAPYPQAKELLKRIKGVGDKVADCIILFGLHNRSAFPVDVWMERVLKQIYPARNKDWPPKVIDMAGIVQQYMFYYAINNRTLLLS